MLNKNLEQIIRVLVFLQFFDCKNCNYFRAIMTSRRFTANSTQKVYKNSRLIARRVMSERTLQRRHKAQERQKQQWLLRFLSHLVLDMSVRMTNGSRKRLASLQDGSWYKNNEKNHSIGRYRKAKMDMNRLPRASICWLNLEKMMLRANQMQIKS